MIALPSRAALRARRRRLRREPGLVSSPPPLAPRSIAVDELYRSLLSSREQARQRLQTLQDIERRHRHTPLADLVQLATAGDLHLPDASRDDVTQR